MFFDPLLHDGRVGPIKYIFIKKECEMVILVHNKYLSQLKDTISNRIVIVLSLVKKFLPHKKNLVL